MTLRFPVAPNPDAAVHQPMGFAMREQEARTVCAGDEVRFVTAWVGPPMGSADEVLAVYGEQLAGQPEHWWSILPVTPSVPVAGRGKGGRPRRMTQARPVFRDGRRWPAPDPETIPHAAWRLSIRYWKTGPDDHATPDRAARKLRRDPTAAELEARALKALAEQPLRPEGPQRALDIGLFEMRPPEAPHIIMPDE